jgi:hypothetical protein
MVLVLSPLLQRYGYGFGLRRGLVLIHGGLRGAVSLALALIVELDRRLDESQRAYVLFYAAGIAFLTLLVNATTSGPLLRWLGLTRANVAEREHFQRSVDILNGDIAEAAQRLAAQDEGALCNWDQVTAFVRVESETSHASGSRRSNPPPSDLAVVEAADDTSGFVNLVATSERIEEGHGRGDQSCWRRLRDPRTIHTPAELRLQQARLRFLRGVIELYHVQVGTLPFKFWRLTR